MLIAGTLLLASSSSSIPREVLGRLGSLGNTALRKCLALKWGEVGGG
jgi:hypothetical protein